MPPSTIGSNVVFRIIIKNTGQTTVASLPLEDTYSADVFQFVSATIPPNSIGAGDLLWTNLSARVRRQRRPHQRRDPESGWRGQSGAQHRRRQRRRGQQRQRRVPGLRHRQRDDRRRKNQRPRLQRPGSKRHADCRRPAAAKCQHHALHRPERRRQSRRRHRRPTDHDRRERLL